MKVWMMGANVWIMGESSATSNKNEGEYVGWHFTVVTSPVNVSIPISYFKYCIFEVIHKYNINSRSNL